MVDAVTRFIPQRPDNNARMVAIALHHARHALAHGGQPGRVVAQAIHRHHAVGFDVGLIHHIQTIAIAKCVPSRMIRIVGAAHGVKVVLLHQNDVLHHRLFVHHLTVFRMMFMTVGAANQQWLTVQQQQAIFRPRLQSVCHPPYGAAQLRDKDAVFRRSTVKADRHADAASCDCHRLRAHQRSRCQKAR